MTQDCPASLLAVTLPPQTAPFSAKMAQPVGRGGGSIIKMAVGMTSLRNMLLCSKDIS